MLTTPTLAPTPVPSIPNGKSPAGAEDPAENGGIAFAFFLPGGAENIGGPVIVDAAELLAGRQASGSPAMPTGKDLPVPANAAPAHSEPSKTSPDRQAATPTGMAAVRQSPVAHIDSLALSTALAAIVPGEAAKAQQTTGAAPAKPVQTGAAIGGAHAGTLGAAAPAGPSAGFSAPAAPTAPARSMPDPDPGAEMANLPRSVANSANGEKDAAPKSERPAVQIQTALKTPESTEQLPTPAQINPVPTSAQQPAAPLATAAQPATSTPALPAPATAPQPADLPRDFSTLIDRLVQAREAAAPSNPATVRTVLTHTEFGAVTVRFDTSGSNLTASFASNDPAFAPAARAALAAEAGQQAQQHASGQPGADSSGSHAHLHSGAQNRGGGHAVTNAGSQTGTDPDVEDEPTDLSAPSAAQASQRGLYI